LKKLSASSPISRNTALTCLQYRYEPKPKIDKINRINRNTN
jgi:hypothetical protein